MYFVCSYNIIPDFMLNLFIRSLSTVAIGVLLLVFREQAMPFIVMCVGLLFLLPALFTLFLTFAPVFKRNASHVNSKKVAVTIISTGSLLLGLWMLFDPGFFIAILMWVLGGILLLVGLLQILGLLRVRKKMKISYMLFVIPVLIFLAGAVILFYPFEAASLPFVILGIAAIFSVVSDMINTIFVNNSFRNGATNVDGEVVTVDGE